MGLFNRKNGSTYSARSADEQSSRSSSNMQSPKSMKTPSSASFASVPPPPTHNVTIPKPPDPAVDPAGYLRSIHSVRERAQLVHKKAKANQLKHFDVDMGKFDETAAYVVSIIKRDFAPDYLSIPPHGRWQHFEIGGRPRIDQLLASWPATVNAQERTRRLLDLFVVSVLLDAGAGISWSYKSKESGRTYKRSEGLAVASLEMFKDGIFSSDSQQPHQVDGKKLRTLDHATLAKGLQVTDKNSLTGLEGRVGLIQRLGQALENSKYFGASQRPGNMLDYILSHPATAATSVPVIPVTTLWEVLMDGFAPIWPASRTSIDGVSLGDAWNCSSLPSETQNAAWEKVAPFHKLTQWMAYSLMTPMSRLLHAHFAGADLLTGLPEYRNGGLLIDTGLLTLKSADMERGLEAFKNNSAAKGQPSSEVVPLFQTDDDVIVEWRAVTVGFLDALLGEVNKQLGLEGRDGLTLAQMLEAGTWKGGRELAEVSRPNHQGAPIMTVSDGTVF